MARITRLISSRHGGRAAGSFADKGGAPRTGLPRLTRLTSSRHGGRLAGSFSRLASFAAVGRSATRTAVVTVPQQARPAAVAAKTRLTSTVTPIKAGTVTARDGTRWRHVLDNPRTTARFSRLTVNTWASRKTGAFARIPLVVTAAAGRSRARGGMTTVKIATPAARSRDRARAGSAYAPFHHCAVTARGRSSLRVASGQLHTTAVACRCPSLRTASTFTTSENVSFHVDARTPPLTAAATVPIKDGTCFTRPGIAITVTDESAYRVASARGTARTLTQSGWEASRTSRIAARPRTRSTAAGGNAQVVLIPLDRVYSIIPDERLFAIEAEDRTFYIQGSSS